jgi:hypothetical protein
MKDYRLRIGMRFVQQGREFVIEGLSFAKTLSGLYFQSLPQAARRS